jgi:hypothetical protein
VALELQSSASLLDRKTFTINNVVQVQRIMWQSVSMFLAAQFSNFHRVEPWKTMRTGQWNNFDAFKALFIVVTMVFV